MLPAFERTLRLPLVGMIVMATFLISSCERSGSPSSGPTPETGPSSESIAVDDPDLGAILKIEEPLIRVERVAAYLQRARADQLGDIRHTFEHSTLDRGDLEYALLIEWWARFDPQAAFEHTVKGDLYGEHPRLRATAARAWARQNPKDALETGYLYDIRALDGSLDGEMLDSLIVGWWESGKPGLTEFISGLKLPSDVARSTKTYARRLIFRDGARAALEAIPGMTEFPDAHRRLILAGALTILSHNDPALAVEWLPIAEARGVDTRTFAMRIVGGWAHHDPLAATEWANRLPLSDDRDRAIQRVAQDWQEKDPEAFLAWLDGQKIGAQLDFVRFLSIRTSVFAAPRKVDWPSLLERSGTIEDETRRDTSILWCLQIWRYLVPDDAKAWLEDHPGVLKPELLARVEQISPGDQSRIDRTIEAQERVKTYEPLVPSP